MSRRLLGTAAVLVALAVGGCGGSSTGPAPVIPNYAGNWSGTYTLTGCTETGGIAAANICSSAVGTAPFTMALTQSGSTVSGNFLLGSVPFTFPSASITTTNGALVLVGTNTTSGINVIATWSLTAPMTGTIAQVWTAAGVTGQININGTILTATKTSSVALPQPLAGGSLKEMMRAITASPENLSPR